MFGQLLRWHRCWWWWRIPFKWIGVWRIVHVLPQWCLGSQQVGLVFMWLEAWFWWSRGAPCSWCKKSQVLECGPSSKFQGWNIYLTLNCIKAVLLEKYDLGCGVLVLEPHPNSFLFSLSSIPTKSICFRLHCLGGLYDTTPKKTPPRLRERPSTK